MGWRGFAKRVQMFPSHLFKLKNHARQRLVPGSPAPRRTHPTEAHGQTLQGARPRSPLANLSQNRFAASARHPQSSNLALTFSDLVRAAPPGAAAFAPRSRTTSASGVREPAKRRPAQRLRQCDGQIPSVQSSLFRLAPASAFCGSRLWQRPRTRTTFDDLRRRHLNGDLGGLSRNDPDGRRRGIRLP